MNSAPPHKPDEPQTRRLPALIGWLAVGAAIIALAVVLFIFVDKTPVSTGKTPTSTVETADSKVSPAKPTVKYRTGIKTVAVPVWTRGKDVYRRGVELRLTEALQKRIELDTPYKVASKTTADTQVVGRIELIEQQVLSFDTVTGLALEREITMMVSFTWTDLRTGKPIVDWTTMRVAGTYRPHEPLSEDFFQGSELVVNKIAKRIVERMEKEW